MSIFFQVLKDLVKMFIADVRMTMTILALVALVAFLIEKTSIDPLLAGWLLLGGCIVLLIASALAAAAKSRK